MGDSPTADSRSQARRSAADGEYAGGRQHDPLPEPTNNGIEQQFRFLIIDRKVTQGTWGEAGRRWCERIWTTLATCAQRGRNPFAYLIETIIAYFHGRAGPSLLALPP
jgi:hypothetical protein